MKSIMVQQESIINQLKSAEHGVRTEFQVRYIIRLCAHVTSWDRDSP